MKKQSKADFLREWGFEVPRFKWTQLRYKSPPEKGVYWYYFSIEVRKRDIEKWGVCISCGKPITMENTDAGHFIPAASCGRDLLFDPLNVNAECKGCNGFDSGHLFGYERGLTKRYGKEAPALLKDKYFLYKNGDPVKDWKITEYRDKIKELNSYQQRMLDIANNVV